MNTDFWKIVESQKSGSWSKLGRQLEIGVGTFKNYHSQYTAPDTGQFMPISTLIKLCNLFGIELCLIEEKNWIEFIKGGQNSYRSGVLELEFPIDFLTMEWAGLTGAILSEGIITKNYGVGFWNTDSDIAENYVRMVQKIAERGPYEDKSFGYFLPSLIGKILVRGLDFSIGGKVNGNVCIPEIYMTAKEESVKNYLLSWLFTGDGWVTLFKDHLGQKHRTIGICFGSKKRNEIPNLIRDVIVLLDSLGIKHSKHIFESRKTRNGKDTYSCKIHIKGKVNFVLFRERIGFQSEKKQKVLDESISSFEKPKLGDKESFNLMLKTIYELYAGGKEIDKHAIAEKTGISESWLERLLKRARDEELIRVVGGGNVLHGSQGGKTPYLYEPSVIVNGLEETR
jgi:hypothetical protein